MTKEQAIEWLKSLNYCDGEETQEVAQAIDMAIKVLEQQSEDCVSRKYIKQIVSNITAEYDTETIHIDRLMDEIDDLPPVTPTHNTCKDCKRYNRNEMFCTWHGGYLMQKCDPDFYCADYEKRGSENE